jgi:ketosteroid isomerase-like protein
MSDLELNKEVCRAFLTAVGRRDIPAALAHVSDDVCWWVQGTWEGAGVYRGKEGVTALLMPLKQALATDLDISFGHLTAEEDRVACEMRAAATTADGRDYRMTYHFLLTIKHGKIQSGNEYLDTKSLWDVLLSKYSIKNQSSSIVE